MQKQTSQLQKAIAYGLIFMGFIGIGFLIFVVVDSFSFDAPSTSLEAEPETALSDSVASEPEVPSDIPTGIRIGQRAPDFRLRSLDNEDVSLSDFLGRVVILDFWASWCSPCRLTMPGLEDLARELAPDVVLLGVNLDQKEKTAVSYLASNDSDAMIALHESYTSALAVFNTYGGGGIPKTYVMDRAGIIRFVGHPASLSRQTIERLI